jgi:coenzyme F420-reducing hydrogenase gamma subunit
MTHMPDYTPEQKEAAFDALWKTCGLGRGILKDWISRDISRPGCPPNEATIVRVPRYSFEIVAEGEMQLFRDVLHHLATRKGVE